MSNVPDVLLEKLARYFSQLGHECTVDVAYLFGSMAKGTARPGSDVDVAVLFPADLSKEERFDRQLALGAELSTYLGQEVDVIDLAATPLILQHQVLLYGKCIFQRDPRVRVAFEVASRRNYFDMKRVWDLHTAGMVKAMEKGEYGGRP